MQYVTTEGTQGICPSGWHIPTDSELCTVTEFLYPTGDCSSGLNGFAGGKIKSTGTIEAGTGLWRTPKQDGGQQTNNNTRKFVSGVHLVYICIKI